MPVDNADIRVTLEEVRGDVKTILAKMEDQNRRIADVEARVTGHDAELQTVKATVLKWTGAGALGSFLISTGFLFTLFNLLQHK